jgi:hypothetical protein
MYRKEDLRRVKSDYKIAFGEWAAQVGRLQSIRQSEEEAPVVDEVRAQAEAAEAAYRETRDQLAGLVCCG